MSLRGDLSNDFDTTFVLGYIAYGVWRRFGNWNASSIKLEWLFKAVGTKPFLVVIGTIPKSGTIGFNNQSTVPLGEYYYFSLQFLHKRPTSIS
jgi:hypothetical protein